MDICHFLAILTLSLHSAYSLTIEVNHKKIITKIEDEVQLVCSADFEKTACSFTSPSGKTLTMSKFSAYEDGRIQAMDTENRQYDCAMKITSIKQTDSGTWYCNVTASDNGIYQVSTNKIEVIVANPPNNVCLKREGEEKCIIGYVRLS